MTESTEPKPELQIKSDADWKHRVKAEAAELDARHGQEKPAAAEEPESSRSAPPQRGDGPAASTSAKADSPQFPPADFPMLVSMFSTQAMVALGVIPSPVDGKAESNLPLARHFIDLLGILDEKTRGNLTAEEARLLEESLHELRMAYVELSRTAPSSGSQ